MKKISSKSPYFSHDFYARNDQKIERLIRDMEYEGYGIFWAIVEKLHQEGGSMKYDLDHLSYLLRIDVEKVKKVVSNYNLFLVNGDLMTSSRVVQNIHYINHRSKKARESVNLRWEKEKYKRNTNVIRTQNERNTIKINEIKLNEMKLNTSITPPSPSENLVSNEQPKDPETIKKETELQKLVKGWKMLNEIPIEGEESKKWDKAHFARQAKTAKALLDLFGFRDALDCMEYVFDYMRERKLDCTLETVLKRSDLFREQLARR